MPIENCKNKILFYKIKRASKMGEIYLGSSLNILENILEIFNKNSYGVPNLNLNLNRSLLQVLQVHPCGHLS